MTRQIGWQDFVRKAQRLEQEQRIVVNFVIKAGRFRAFIRYDDELAQAVIADLLDQLARAEKPEPRRKRRSLTA